MTVIKPTAVVLAVLDQSSRAVSVSPVRYATVTPRARAQRTCATGIPPTTIQPHRASIVYCVECATVSSTYLRLISDPITLRYRSHSSRLRYQGGSLRGGFRASPILIPHSLTGDDAINPTFSHLPPTPQTHHIRSCGHTPWSTSETPIPRFR
ncbi:hypothetical protein F5Y18DRAFT_241958 [Xylariaceae sp. FL1019]|nr:hypothetical protein F5Y18DRAFT_241958 [Xylariaceae sp. FL1019]